jgi:hypothetical protein
MRAWPDVYRISVRWKEGRQVDRQTVAGANKGKAYSAAAIV